MTLMSEYTTDTRLTRDQLADIPTPLPLGHYHHPVSFHTYVEEVAHQLSRCGLEIAQEEHLVGHENQRYFGLMEIQPALEGQLIAAKDWRILLGLRGSHDQSVQRGVALGRSVIVCSNLCFSGDIYTSSTKQTTHIWDRLPQIIFQALSALPEMAHLEERRVQALKDFTMKPRWGDAALVEIWRRGGLNAAQFGRAVNEWDRPKHEEFAASGHTAWRLEQAVTEAVKPTGQRSNMFQTQDRTRIASDFLTEVVGF